MQCIDANPRALDCLSGGMHLRNSAVSAQADSTPFLPRLRRFVITLPQWWRLHRESADTRQLVALYLDLDDRLLDDIGLLRSEVTAVLKLPLSIDASQELAAIRSQRISDNRRFER